MIADKIPLSKVQACAVLIMIIFVAKLYAVLTIGSDLALFIADYNRAFCPAHCWSFPENIPYSVVWTWYNPLWLGRFWYDIYIFAFDALTTIGFWKIKRIPKLYLALWQLLSITFYWTGGAEYQNVAIFAWLPLMFLAITNREKFDFYAPLNHSIRSTCKAISRWRLYLIALIPILIKLPLGWGLPWIMNNHVACIWECNGFSNIVAANYGLQWKILHSVPGVILNYTVLIFGWSWTIQQVKKAIK